MQPQTHWFRKNDKSFNIVLSDISLDGNAPRSGCEIRGNHLRQTQTTKPTTRNVQDRGFPNTLVILRSQIVVFFYRRCCDNWDILEQTFEAG
jgi:hypothetical protein